MNNGIPGTEFPILISWRESPPRRVSVPWAMVAPHARQAERNHGGQTLRRLAERGGLGWCEMCAVLEDRAWHRMDQAVAEAQVHAAVRAYTATTTPSDTPDSTASEQVV